ncbi:Rrp15p-domain-containing protein [Umbelopsis sp. PMI_123]|nr:Rrp15p-domain-containing protein [Umbelopsis sp. PMI_123]
MPPKKQIKLAIARPKKVLQKKEDISSSSGSEDESDAVVGKLDELDSDLESMDGDDEFSGAEDDGNEAMDQDEVEVKPKKGSSDSFAVAMTKILGSNLKGSDKQQPILARSKGAERKIEDEKLEYKARKLLAAEKKALASKDRIIPDYTTMDYEKKLRKVATRGVVKLFNAIRTQQKVTDVAVSRAADTSSTSRAIEKAKNVSTMPKSSFLELLKTGTS